MGVVIRVALQAENDTIGEQPVGVPGVPVGCPLVPGNADSRSSQLAE